MQNNIRETIANEAMEWLRTPWHHQANIKGVGVDCAMFIISVYKNCGLLNSDFDVENYARDWHLHHSEEKFLKYIQQNCKEVKTAFKGDIALFKFGRCISHGGIMLNDVDVIHAFIDVGEVTISNMWTNLDLNNRFAGFYRLNTFCENKI